jgi:acetoin utilization protein AcuC
MPEQVIFLSDEALWQRGHGPDHPLKPERLRRTHELLEETGALEWPNVRVLAPRPATEEELTLFHRGEYIDAVRALSNGDRSVPPARYGFGPGDNPVFSGMYDSEGLKVGGAVQGAELLLAGEAGIAFNYSGGLHHGAPRRASGFCVFNDAAVAIHRLLGEGLRVAYVDVDVHHGDGVQDAFYESDQVLTVSLHQSGRTLFPGTGFLNEYGEGAGQGYSVNVPLPPGTTDDAYLEAFRALVPPIVRRFAPDVLVTQMGVDTHYRDPLANLSLTTRGHEAIFEELHALSPGRWLALGGGGYAVEVVPRAWALALAVMAEQELPEKLPPGYREKYGGLWLRDREVPNWVTEGLGRMRERVDGVIEAARERYGVT